MSKPIIAVVGRPNVGKSTLFNKLVGRRLSIVEDTPGVTRDRVYAECEWLGKEVMLVDTGGIEPFSDSEMLAAMRRQAQIAIDSAAVIILVTDIRSGVTATDSDVAAMLQKSGKPVVLCVNKCDTIGEPPPEFYEFYNLGLGDPVAVSASHGHGTGDLLDAAFAYIDFDAADEYNEEYIKVAVIGKPNVGKSSLVNKIAGEERAIVSDVAGTTRDAIEVQLDLDGYPVTMIDTAGIRETDDPVEQEGVRRARAKAAEADLVLWLTDSPDPGARRAATAPAWIVRNKVDLDAERGGAIGRANSETAQRGVDFEISAKQGDGIGELVSALVSFADSYFGGGEGGLITRERQRRLLEETSRSLHRSIEVIGQGDEFAAEDLRAAAYTLGRLLGRVDVEDILDVIFREFCIGK